MRRLSEIGFDFNGENLVNSTHSFHPYPAKFPPKLPRKILSSFSQEGEKVLDPFCGSGTTLVEAKLRGIDCVGVDVNGLACLLSKVKATPLTKEKLKYIEITLQEFADECFSWQIEKRKRVEIHQIEGLLHWFQPNVSEELSYLRQRIWKIEDDPVRDFFKVVLSSIIVRVSNQESDTRFAAIEKNIQDGFTFHRFVEKAKSFFVQVKDFSRKAIFESDIKVYHADSRDLSFLQSETFDLIITSPPYANTYDYYLYHKFRKRWLDLDVKFAQYNEIGSRREFSSLKKPPEKWVEDLEKSLSEISRVLKKGKYAFIVIGDSVIRKQLLKIDEVIADIAPRFSLNVVDILSSDLAKHSKLFNPAFTQRGKKEHLIQLRKEHD